ncbi:HK97 family phage prohead protease [bacterium]|nr:HK97 family phage prohead protease [bacterium]
MLERYFSPADLTTEDTDHSPGTLSGYVTRWNLLSHDRGGYRDLFRAGAFANLADEGHDVHAYRDHDATVYLGRSTNNTLRLATDEVGLKFSLDLPDTQDGRDTAALVRRGDFGGMSFGYLANEYQWRKLEHGPVREHLSGQLVEISVVFSPAFDKTSVELNALDAPRPEVLASLQDWLGTPRRNSAARRIKLSEIVTNHTM